MNTTAPTPIPETRELLVAMKFPKKPDRFHRIEKATFAAFLMFVGIILVAVAAKMAGVGLGTHTLKLAVIWAVTGIYLSFAMWILVLLGQIGLMLKQGFAARADDVDDAIEREQVLLTRLLRCCPKALAERGARLEFEAKRQVKRYGLIAIFVSAGAVAIQLHDAGGQAQVWSRLTELSIWIYAGALGALIGAGILVSFASKLDRVAHLLLTASTRGGV